MLRNGPEERSSHLLRDGILKSVNVRFSLFAERTDSCLMYEYLGMVEGLLLLIQLWKKRFLLTCGAPLNLNTTVQAGRHELKVCTEKIIWHWRPYYMATLFSGLLSIFFCGYGFGGLGVACWPLVPKFAGSNPAEAVGFLRAKKSSARLPSEGK